MQLQDDYFAAYRSLKLTRDASGVLVVEFHSNGGPFTFTAQDHTEFVDAFYRIAQDRANKIVILTGAGGEFIPEIDFSSFDNVADPGPSAEAQAWMGERDAALAAAVRELPAEQRRVIVMAYFGGLSQSEIAAATATPLGTVKKRTSLGLAKLRRAVAGQGSARAREG